LDLQGHPVYAQRLSRRKKQQAFSFPAVLHTLKMPDPSAYAGVESWISRL
jgi:hypothetical protein